MARKGIVSTKVDEVNRIVSFTVEGCGKLAVSLGELNPAIVAYAALHGMKQRIGDAAALDRNKETGKSATPADKFAAMKQLVDHYASGTDQWNVRGSGERSEGSDAGLTYRAIAAVQGANVDAVKKRVAEMAEKRGVTTKAILAKFRTYPAVMAELDKLRAERIDEDADDMLEELMSGGSDESDE